MEHVEVVTETLKADAGEGKIACLICSGMTHVMQKHLHEAHEDITLPQYMALYPNTPIYSERAKKALEERSQKVGANTVEPAILDTEDMGDFKIFKKHLHEVFKLGISKAAMSARGTPIPIQTFVVPDALSDLIFAVDPNYVWNIDLLKKVLLALEINMPCFLWGHAGTGKSTAAMQATAATGRPAMRIQHTANMEESHVLGQWIVQDGATKFELGPLPYAMLHGLTYIADEYDFALPQILSVYQPVLEGNPLVIKEADHANRVIKPHPAFRFIATGNTNGTGDDTGLYQGTRLQNAANFERFGIVEEVKYPDKKIEIKLVSNQAYVDVEKAEIVVNYGNMIREAYSNNKIGAAISPRALINACKIAKRLGSLRQGLTLAYINRLSRVDQEVAREVMMRYVAE